ncbi:acylphosphatase [Paraburkholderia sp. WSM4179]|nr:acylphosphatase [Paraburkholderia sp. WSM4179]
MDADDEDGMPETRLVRVRGQVQGIGYRDSVRTPGSSARRLRLGAQPDGRFGRNDAAGLIPCSLPKMCAWLSGGMSVALVDELEVTGVQPAFARLDHFERLSTL